MDLHSDSDSLLNLLASLTERDSTDLQIKLNNYLARVVAARLAFLAILSPDEEELLVHVLGDSCLPARVKIAVKTPCFSRALSTRQPTTLEHLDSQQQEDLFKVLRLLHSPAHLAASRQTSRSLSIGAPPSVGSSDDDNSSYKPHSSAGAAPIAVPASDGFTSQLQHHDALLADNVFVSAKLTETSHRRPDRLSLINGPSVSTVRYVQPETFLCVPLLNPDTTRPVGSDCPDDEVTADVSGDTSPSTVVLACLIDKTTTRMDEEGRLYCEDEQNDHLDFRKECKHGFDDDDVERVLNCFKYTLPLLLTTLAYEAERRQRQHCQTMLGVAQNLFARLEDVSSLLQEIMSEARSLTDAERCSLFLLDQDKKELVAKVFDGQTNDGSSESEVRLPSTAGIAGHVATTGRLLNIRDAYTHPLFYRGFDEKTGFRTRNLLCFPIQAGEDHHVIGVAELCNKTTGRFFTQFDEQLATSFSVFCGIAITHSLLYSKVSDAHARIKLSNELMMLHMNVTKDEVDRLTSLEVPEPAQIHPDFYSFRFFPRVIPEASSPLSVISMMVDLGIPQRWSIPAHTLARFVLMVRKGYRDPPYHNWVHAFSVTHFAFLLIKNLRLCETGSISHMEALALITSCLCHDLDHRGTTNSFQVDSNSVLASLYSSEGSVMERHHLAQAMCILNTESCNIFEYLSKEEYTQCLDLMRAIILATDLAHHLRLLGELKQMVKDGYDPSNSRHRHLCICLLMTSADLSDQTKDWEASRSVAKLIYKEFFTQGDLEKAMGNNPLVMMDREKAFIPELQISFLDNIALPVYELIAALFPEANEPYEAVLESRRRWTEVKDMLMQRKSSITSSLDIFDGDLIS